MIVGNLERSMEELYTNLHHLWRFQIQSLMDNRYKGQGNPLVHWLFYQGALLTQDMKKKPTTGNTPLGETVIFTQQTLMKTHIIYLSSNSIKWNLTISYFCFQAPSYPWSRVIRSFIIYRYIQNIPFSEALQEGPFHGSWRRALCNFLRFIPGPPCFDRIASVVV